MTPLTAALSIAACLGIGILVALVINWLVPLEGHLTRRYSSMPRLPVSVADVLFAVFVGLLGAAVLWYWFCG